VPPNWRAAVGLSTSRRAGLRLGLELIVPSGGRRSRDDFSELVAIVEAAEAAGITSIWLQASADGAVDPVPVLAGLVARTNALELGLCCLGGSGRHPAILARDLTTLDIVSGGRAALCLRAGGPQREAEQRLSESVQICHLLFSPEDQVTFRGEYFSVEQAANRPAPEQRGGPALLIDLGRAPTPTDDLLGVLVPLVDGVVVEGSPELVADARRTLDAQRGPGSQRADLVWRVAADAGVVALGGLAGDVTAAGANGVIVGFAERHGLALEMVTAVAEQVLPVLQGAG
jgi:hypothetical protein